MFDSILDGLIASGIAFSLGVVARSTWGKWRVSQVRKSVSQRVKVGDPAYSAAWIAAYYRNRGSIDQLYSSRILNGHWVQFLTKPEWLFDAIDDGTLLRQDVPQRIATYSGDVKSLRKRQYALRSPNGDDWNDFHAASFGVTQGPSGPAILVGVCKYRDYLAVAGGLEDETFSAIAHPKRARTPIRDAFFSTADDAAASRLGLHSIGMVTALVYWDAGIPMVLIHRRSEAVSTYAGAMGVVPMFSLQTRDLSERTEISLTNNFYRELFEELYGGEEAQSASKRVAKDWYHRSTELSRYVKDGGESKLRILGFGFDARNGQLIVGSMYLMRDLDFAGEEVAKMRGNWEMSDIDALPLGSDQLLEMIRADQFTPACSFTLLRCMEIVL